MSVRRRLLLSDGSKHTYHLVYKVPKPNIVVVSPLEVTVVGSISSHGRPKYNQIQIHLANPEEQHHCAVASEYAF